MNAPFLGRTRLVPPGNVCDFSPDTVSRADLWLARQWCRRRCPVASELAGLPLQLSFTIGPPTILHPPLCQLHFTIGGQPGAISAPVDAVDALLRAIDAPSAATLGERSLLLILEYAGASALDQLDHALGVPIALTGASIGGGFADGILCSGALGDWPFEAGLTIPEPHAARVALLAGAFNPLPAADIPVTVAFRVGGTRLGVGWLGSVRPGDVVILDHALLEGRIAAVFGEHRLASCRIDGNRAILLDRPVRIGGDLHQNWTAADTMTHEGTDTRAKDADLDEMQIKLLFELGRLEISLGELRTLAPGYVFDLGRDPSHAVEIHAGGRRIGHGEVVKIGEALGVRIVGLFNQE
jgi:type III secretion protein Q